MTAMPARQLPLRMYDELTPFDHQLMGAIRAGADPETGLACSLFDVAVRRAGLSYWYSLYRLDVLTALGCVEVWRTGPSKPLVMRLLV